MCENPFINGAFPFKKKAKKAGNLEVQSAGRVQARSLDLIKNHLVLPLGENPHWYLEFEASKLKS